MEKKFQKTFDKCPCCGGTERFFESMANELKEHGWAREQWTFSLDSKQGIVADKQSMSSMPLGAELPAYQFQTDICLNCGCIYAKVIGRSIATEKPDLFLPTDPLGRG